MTPADAIAMLDRQLADHGENVTYHVVTAGAADAGALVRAFVRGLKPEELVGTISQKDRKVTLSPSSGVAPVEGNRFDIAGKDCTIIAVEPVRLNSAVVRYNVVVKG